MKDFNREVSCSCPCPAPTPHKIIDPGAFPEEFLFNFLYRGADKRLSNSGEPIPIFSKCIMGKGRKFE